MLAQLAKSTNASMFFPTAETPAAPGAEQQPTPGRLPLAAQRGVSVPGQDAAGREPRYGGSATRQRRRHKPTLGSRVGEHL